MLEAKGAFAAVYDKNKNNVYTIGGCNYYKKDKVKALSTCSRFNVEN
jgi:hypothetical protein